MRPIRSTHIEASHSTEGGKADLSNVQIETLFYADKAHGLPCRGAQRTRIWAGLVFPAWQHLIPITITL